MNLSKTSYFVVGVVTAVAIGGGGTAVAANAGLVLGQKNVAPSTTTLTSRQGPALSLKANGPALKVSNSKKVANLNSDSLDGLDSSAFARTAGKTGVYEYYGLPLDTDGNGLDDVIFAYASCPRGTQMTGGEGGDFTSTGYLMMNSPDTDVPESWDFAVGIDENTVENEQDVYASVVCYSADGSKLPGSFRAQTRRSDVPPATVKKLAATVASRQ
jgi:hypothetical protein